MSSLIKTYGRIPLSFSRGQGSILTTETGEEYLDFLSGVSVNSLGHNHPIVLSAIQKAATKPLHLSNWLEIPEQEALGEKLSNLALNPLNPPYQGDLKEYKAFFCNSGAEANEAALKLARKKTGRSKYLSFSGGFHGRTYGALSVTAKKAIQQDFEPLLQTCEVAEYNSVDDLEKIDKDTAAVILEFIQGESGVYRADPEWIQKLFKRAKETGTLIIADEVQTGVGRTGTFFAFEPYGVQPDIITMAKALGNGLPIGAMLAKEEVAESFGPGSHGSTFGGNPFVCTVASAIVNEISQADFLQEVNQKSEYFLKKLQAVAEEFPNNIKEIRGKGFLIGIEFHGEEEGKQVFEVLKEKNILANLANPKVIRALPPLIITTEELDQFCEVLREILNK